MGFSGITATPVKGGPILKSFPFAYNTPNLASGVPIYTPQIGEVLLNAWFSILIPWNGTTPQGDFGQFNGDTGWFSTLGQNVPWNMTMPDNTASQAFGEPLIRNSNYSDLVEADIYDIGGIYPASQLNVPPPPTTQTLISSGYAGTITGIFNIPAIFVSAAPVQICVSQEGAFGLLPSLWTGAGAVTLPVTINALNDQIEFGPTGTPTTYTAPHGTYPTVAALASALNTISGLNSLVNFNDQLLYPAPGTGLEGRFTTKGPVGNGYSFAAPGSNGFFVGAGLAAFIAAGAGGVIGTSPGATQGQAIAYLLTSVPAVL